MIYEFMRLKALYASKEITLDDLKALQASKIVSFINHGISRSQKACLLCEVHFSKLKELITLLLSGSFATVEAFKRAIVDSDLDLNAKSDVEEGLIVYSDKDGLVEIIAQVGDDGSIKIEADDIDAETSFQVFLRIQA